jgi:hypothetical protein
MFAGKYETCWMACLLGGTLTGIAQSGKDSGETGIQPLFDLALISAIAGFCEKICCAMA